MIVPAALHCGPRRLPLAADPPGDVEDARSLLCASGCQVPVVRGVPRFVSPGHYAGGFGLQWNAYRRTQRDSHTGATISWDRLTRCLGGDLGVVRDRDVLEVGCGAGRFTEVLLASGARLVACDLSEAVEANRANCARLAEPGRYFVCQADVADLPVAPGSFDLVIALGMVQHTPSPERTIETLAAQLKPGGLLVLDHYTWPPGAGALFRLASALSPRSLIRHALRPLPARAAFAACTALTRALLPVHRLFWRRGTAARAARRGLHLASPIFDYYDKLPQLSREQLTEWALLDTHDGLTDRFKHRRSGEEIASALTAAGLVELDVQYAGNGVEARARRGPTSTAPSVDLPLAKS
ncbi:MAG TPA: class I SAM-dependent methyltransferase [Vicinamibacteria bacterium]